MRPLGEDKDQNYEAILLQSIDEALLTLGENVRLSIYFHLQTKFGLSKHEMKSSMLFHSIIETAICEWELILIFGPIFYVSNITWTTLQQRIKSGTIAWNSNALPLNSIFGPTLNKVKQDQ